jgi:hypothetical protein
VIWLHFYCRFSFLFCFFSFFRNIFFIFYIHKTATTDEKNENKHREKEEKKKIVVNWISLKVCQNYVELISHSNVLHHWIKSHSFLPSSFPFLAWFYFIFFERKKLFSVLNIVDEWFVSVLVGLGGWYRWRWLYFVMKYFNLNLLILRLCFGV